MEKRSVIDGPQDEDEPAVGGLQDEDDSCERDAALSSPMKGKDSRKSSKVCYTYIFLARSDLLSLKTQTRIKVKREEDPMPLPPGTVKIFNTVVLPTWTEDVMSSLNPWGTVDDFLEKLQYYYDLCLGEAYPHTILKNSDAYNKV